jgi:drug/metabolite transporter (DMT)-like permease
MSGEYWLYAGASIALNLLANWLFLRAVTISPLSLTTPYLALTPVFSALVAFFTLGQTVSGWGVLGIVTVCVGAFFLNPGAKSDGPLAPIKALWSERGSLYMVLVSLLWSITPILDRKASVLTSPLWHTGFLALGIGAVTVAWLLARGGVGKLVGELKIMPAVIMIAAFLLFAAMVLQLSAYNFVAIAYVETFKRAIGVVGAMAAGFVFFGEKDIARRFVGAGVMVVGVALVLFSAG